jgi:Sulfotransferase domain
MKIFQIGFNKCGTSTIHRYLRANGVKCVHWDDGRLARRMFANLANGDNLMAGYEGFDAFTDMEYVDRFGTLLEGNKLFPYLAAQYPDAVFILNTRDREAWIRSRLAWRGDYAARHRAHYNVVSNEQLADVWRAEWDRHHSRVTNYFAGKSHRFFICRIESDLPHLLNEKLPEYRLDDKLYEVRKVARSRRRPGALQQIAKLARKRLISLIGVTQS